MVFTQYSESSATITLIKGQSGKLFPHIAPCYANGIEPPANMRVLSPFLETEVITYCAENGGMCACVIQKPSADHIRQNGSFRPAVLLKKVSDDTFSSNENSESFILTALLKETQTRANLVLKDIPASMEQ